MPFSPPQELDAKYEQMRSQSGDAHSEVKKVKETRNRMETNLKQKYMKLANLRRILGDALLTNFQVGSSQIDRLIAYKFS